MSTAGAPEKGLSVQALLVRVFGGVVFVVLARVGDPTHPFLDTDLWWHLANGRYILAHGVPGQDVYSHTAAGHVWLVHEWLADILFYGLYQVGGLPILAVLTAAMVATGMLLVLRSLRLGGLGHISGVVIAFVLFIASSPSFGARPQVINFMLTALLVAYLLRYRLRRAPSAWWLFPFFVLWANLHSGYVVGVGLLAAFTLAEALQTASSRLAGLRQEGVGVLARAALRPLWAMIPLGFAAGLLTPGTYRTLFFAFGTLGSQTIQSFIIEWFSPDFHSVQGRALLVCIIILVAGLLATRRGIVSATSDPTFVLWGLASLTLALTSQRHVPIFAVAAAPLLGAAGAGALGALGARPRRVRAPTPGMVRINQALQVGLILLAAGYSWWSLRPSVVSSVVAAVEPVAATDWLLANHPQRELFNNYGFGGWLVWKAYPDYPVFIDGRIEVYGDSVFNDYLAVESLADNWSDVLDRRGVKTIVTSPGDRVGLLLPQHGWRAAHKDAVAWVWVRA